MRLNSVEGTRAGVIYKTTALKQRGHSKQRDDREGANASTPVLLPEDKNGRCHKAPYRAPSSPPGLRTCSSTWRGVSSTPATSLHLLSIWKPTSVTSHSTCSISGSQHLSPLGPATARSGRAWLWNKCGQPSGNATRSEQCCIICLGP